MRTSCRSISILLIRTAASDCSMPATKLTSSTCNTSWPRCTTSPSSTKRPDTLPMTSEESMTSSSWARKPEARIDGLMMRRDSVDTFTALALVPNTARLMKGSAMTVPAIRTMRISFLAFIKRLHSPQGLLLPYSGAAALKVTKLGRTVAHFPLCECEIRPNPKY